MTHNGSEDVDLNLVAVFARVVELGSFTAAAKALGLPKSSVSRAVTRLEESLGVRLLQRTTRKLGLTQAGTRYLAEVRGPLQRLAEASQRRGRVDPRAARTGAPEHGARVGRTDAMSAMLVEFVRKYPRVQIDLVITSSPGEPGRGGHRPGPCGRARWTIPPWWPARWRNRSWGCTPPRRT